MHKLDPHTLFSIFEKGDEEVYQENGHEALLKNPFVLMGMVLRGLDNYKLMSLIYSRKFPEEFKNSEPTIKYKYYTRLFNYLKNIDIDKYETLYHVGESFDKNEIDSALQVLLDYFVSIEHYEKCAVIVQYKDLLILEQVYDILNKPTIKK